MMRSVRMAGCLSAACLLLGCTGMNRQQTPAAEATAADPYAAVQQVFDAKCTRCHGGAVAAQGLRLDAWDHVVAGSDHANVVIPFAANHSLLFNLSTQLVGGPHPKEIEQAEPLSEADVALLRTWINEGARSGTGTVPYADADNLVYVCNQGGAFVSILDLNTKRVVRTVDLTKLGFGENAKPHHIVIEPDGSAWYLSLIGENKVLKFNAKNELVAQTDFETPGMMALHPTKPYLYVGRSMTAVNAPHRIGIIGREDLETEELDIFYPRPHALTISPDGQYIYSASLAENSMATVDTETESIEMKTLDGPAQTLVQFALSPDGNTLVVTGQLSGKLLIFDSSDPKNLKQVGSVDVPPQPFHPVFSPDGRHVYFGTYVTNTITVVDVQEQRVVKTIEGPGIAEPHDAAVSSDGRYVFVTSSNMKMTYTPRYNFGHNHMDGTLVIVDTRTNTIDEVVEVGAMPTGIGVRHR